MESGEGRESGREVGGGLSSINNGFDTMYPFHAQSCIFVFLYRIKCVENNITYWDWDRSDHGFNVWQLRATHREKAHTHTQMPVRNNSFYSLSMPAFFLFLFHFCLVSFHSLTKNSFS